MARLRDRSKFIPGGFRFLQPQVPRWSVTPWSSFDSCVHQIIQMRNANPLITRNNGLSVDPEEVANELDRFNTKICQEMGWLNFIWEGGGDPPPAPFPRISSLSQSAGRVAAGVKTLAEWSIDGSLVPDDLAENRATICATCPKNGSAPLTDWFTVPASELIKKELEKRNQLRIYTSRDPLLGVCEACACPLKLKVHCPLTIINEKMRPEDRAQLDPRCWILKESNE